MSFILDALKKSESDRQRQSGPSLFEVKVAPPRRTLPIWAVAIAVLLGVNVIVVSWMLLRRPSAPQPAVAATTAPAVTPPAAIPSAPGPTASTAQRALPSAAPAPAPAPPAATAPPAASPSVSAPPAAATHSPPPPADTGAAGEQNPSSPAAAGDPSDYAPAVEPGGAQGSGAAQGAAGDALPLYQQIVDSAGLPPLHLDLHVFADRPRDRFVMINMHRVGEGDSLPGGVQVDTIRPDGVVLTYHGTRFLLPRN